MKISLIKFKFPHFDKNGFTLIELLVVFSIISILSTVSIASYVSFSRQQTLNQAANDFINTLNTAKAKSGSQIKPNIVECNTKSLDGYGVSLNISSSTYALYVRCSGVSKDITPTSLPQNVTFNSSSITDVFFPVLSGGAAYSGTGDVSFTSFSYSKTVNVSTAGVIK